MRLGLDFGTTNSAIALFDGKQLFPIQIDTFSDNPNILPSLIYIDKEHQIDSGLPAAMAYLEHETGRIVQWRQREVGQIDITVASLGGDPIQFYDAINVMVDIAANGKLLQSIKTVLFNSKYEGTQIFERFYRIEELISIILQRLKTAAEAQLNRPIESIVLGRPVRFSHHELINNRAESILFKAAHLAGFNDVSFQLEPIGIVHLIHRTNQTRKKALIFDFGGGTLDLTIASIGGKESPDILATHGVLVGGDDLNRRIMQYLLPNFGDDDYDYPLPPDIADKLLAWQTIPDLSRPRMIEHLNELRRKRDHTRSLDALETLVSKNLGFQLFQEIERVKKALSDDDKASIQFEYDNIDIRQILTRRRFERLIADEHELVQEGIEEILQAANLQISQIDIVVRTGGSSQIPLFIELLSDMFGKEKLEAIDPLVSVVGGFAITAYEHQNQEIVPPEKLIHSPEQGEKTVNLTKAYLKTRVYADHDYQIDRIPPILNGATLIQASHLYQDSTSDNVLKFTLKQDAVVWVAYDDADLQSIPQWLKAFTPEPLQLVIKHAHGTNTHFLHVYRKYFPKGDVVLGGNHAEGYHGHHNMNYVVLLSPA